MPPKKSQAFDWTRLTPFIIPLVMAGGTYFVLQYRVDAAEKKIEAVETNQKQSSDKFHELQLEQRDIKSKVDQGYEILKELKAEMKKK